MWWAPDGLTAAVDDSYELPAIDDLSAIASWSFPDIGAGVGCNVSTDVAIIEHSRTVDDDTAASFDSDAGCVSVYSWCYLEADSAGGWAANSLMPWLVDHVLVVSPVWAGVLCSVEGMTADGWFAHHKALNPHSVWIVLAWVACHDDWSKWADYNDPPILVHGWSPRMHDCDPARSYVYGVPDVYH